MTKQNFHLPWLLLLVCSSHIFFKTLNQPSKPWSKEDCRDRYVRGSKISLQQLAVESGNKYKTINNWSRSDEPKWSVQRKSFEAEVRLKSDHKAIEKTSDHLSNLTTEHLKSYQSGRKVIDTYFAWLNGRLDEVKAIPERLEAELKSIRASNLNFMLLGLERAINGERTAAGLEWENVPKAIAFLQRLGYTITDPSLPPESDAEAALKAATKGLSEEVAEQVWAGILGIPEDAPSPVELPGTMEPGQVESKSR